MPLLWFLPMIFMGAMFDVKVPARAVAVPQRKPQVLGRESASVSSNGEFPC